MADPTGLEPVTSTSVVLRSNPTELRVHKRETIVDINTRFKKAVQAEKKPLL